MFSILHLLGLLGVIVLLPHLLGWLQERQAEATSKRAAKVEKDRRRKQRRKKAAPAADAATMGAGVSAPTPVAAPFESEEDDDDEQQRERPPAASDGGPEVEQEVWAADHDDDWVTVGSRRQQPKAAKPEALVELVDTTGNDGAGWETVGGGKRAGQKVGTTAKASKTGPAPALYQQPKQGELRTCTRPECGAQGRSGFRKCGRCHQGEGAWEGGVLLPPLTYSPTTHCICTSSPFRWCSVVLHTGMCKLRFRAAPERVCVSYCTADCSAREHLTAGTAGYGLQPAGMQPCWHGDVAVQLNLTCLTVINWSIEG